MAPANVLPTTEECIDLYLRIWDGVGTTPFDPEDLTRVRAESESDAPDREGPQHLRRALETLVAYGLLDGAPDDRYRVRCRPDESVETWRETFAARAEVLHRQVSERYDSRHGGGGSTTRAPTEPLEHAGDTFESVYVDADTDFTSVVETIDELDAGDGHTGVVLRSTGVLAARVQQIADRLCGADQMAGTPLSGRFEKEHTDLVGADKDTLEFRLFLRPTE